ncbi:MAG TPA: electron transfer flavoprotein subunit alpha/FixB family protein, partial [Bacteroidales bacterium]|nr:electron transfer flavoprotein subunit alpha/FixB family protein [Bacteroidales bacterium]
MELSNYKNIFVFVEQRDREIQNVSYELVGKARELAEKNNEQVVAVLLGYQMDAQLETLIHYGADRVLYASNSELDQYQTEPYAQAFTQIVKSYKPAVVLIGATTIGRDLAPRLS